VNFVGEEEANQSEKIAGLKLQLTSSKWKDWLLCITHG